jgi:hypothetical protein
MQGRTVERSPAGMQGCQMAHFQNKNPNLGKFWRVLQWKMLVYFVWPYGILCGHLVKFMVIWYNFSALVCCTKKNLAALQVSTD